MASRRQEFLAGSKDVFSLAVGVASLMTIWGAVALNAGIPAWIAQLMTLLVFAGSQFIMVQLMVVSTPAGMIIAASSLLNLRHLLYSASVAPLLKDLHPLWKGVLAYLLTDEAFAVSHRHYQQHGRGTYTHWYLLGAGLTVWVAAQMSTAAGLFLAARLPSVKSKICCKRLSGRYPLSCCFHIGKSPAVSSARSASGRTSYTAQPGKPPQRKHVRK